MKKIIVVILSIVVLIAAVTSWSNVYASRMEDEIALETITGTEDLSQATLDEISGIPGEENVDLPQAATELGITKQGTDLAATVQTSPPGEPIADLEASTLNQNGNSQGRRQAGKNGLNTNSQANIPDELITITGAVDSYLAPQLSLAIDGTQIINIQVGDLLASDASALSLIPGEQVSVTGWYDTYGKFVANQITILATGQIYTVRNQTGRPEWAGQGQGQGQGNQ